MLQVVGKTSNDCIRKIKMKINFNFSSSFAAVSKFNSHMLQNTRIKKVEDVLTPAEVIVQNPLTDIAAQTVFTGRQEIENIIDGSDKRLLVVVGPCSIHDEQAAYEYAHRLQPLRVKYADKLCIVMRVYFEKPRTTVGWKGLLVNPDVVGQSDFNKGRLLARRILVKINEIGLPAVTEILDPATPQVIDDLISMGAIGARTTESQTHREMASGLSFPVGFKNGTSGRIKIAIDAMLAAREPHSFMGIEKATGKQCHFVTTGNPYTQLILRGGENLPNYDTESVKEAVIQLKTNNLPISIMVDCSHKNAEGDYRKQHDVLHYVLKNRGVDYPIQAVMIESNLKAGKQPEGPLSELEYGQSITDACVGWEETEEMLKVAYESVEL